MTTDRIPAVDPAHAHAMASTEFIDPYVDPETDVLHNKVGARAQIALDDVESDLSFARLVQAMDYPPKTTGDLDELRAIHGCLLQDVYDWVGQVRTVDVRKNVEGAEFFLPTSMIDRAASYATEELRAQRARSSTSATRSALTGMRKNISSSYLLTTGVRVLILRTQRYSQDKGRLYSKALTTGLPHHLLTKELSPRPPSPSSPTRREILLRHLLACAGWVDRSNGSNSATTGSRSSTAGGLKLATTTTSAHTSRTWEPDNLNPAPMATSCFLKYLDFSN